MQLTIEIDPPLTGQVNMAKDEANFERVTQSQSEECLIRIYEWLEPTISLGVSQKTDILNLGLMEQDHISWVRRVTGGSAVLHARELTYSVVGPSKSQLFGKNLFETYHVIAQSLLNFLASIGVQANLNQTRLSSQQKSGICFADSSLYEIMVNQKKLIGSAQKRGARAFLQHGSLPIYTSPEIMGNYLIPPQREMTEHSIKLTDLLKECDLDFLKLKLKTQFQTDFK